MISLPFRRITFDSCPRLERPTILGEGKLEDTKQLVGFAHNTDDYWEKQFST